MRPAFISSGDLLADRRYALGQASAKAGDLQAAAELFEQALELAPRWSGASFALASARRELGDLEGARAGFQKCLEHDGADAQGASLELARLGLGEGGAAVAGAPPAYIAALFDAYADEFDAALVARLDYRGPELIAAALEPERRRFARTLDLGCGTGLCGAALRAHSDRLEGVDLSVRMIAKARERGVYDALECASIEDRLSRDDGPFDLIAAADVFSYFGDLAPTLRAIARRLTPPGLLTPGGLCAFTVEAGDGENWTIAESLRFVHSEAYVRRAVAQSGLAIVSLTAAPLRLDRGAPIRALIVVAARRVRLIRRRARARFPASAR
ncbi:MAG: methyltransferase [Parvularculaceae bacterium]